MYTVQHVAVEIFGPINREGLAFLSETRSRLCSTTGDARNKPLVLLVLEPISDDPALQYSGLSGHQVEAIEV